MSTSSEKAMIRTRGLGKAFGPVQAVSDLDLDVMPGEFFGFLGPNGSGKSTTIKLLTTLLMPTAGSMEVAGFDVQREPLEVKRRIGVLPEELHTYERLTVEELLAFSGRIHGLGRDDVRSRSAELLDLMELAGSERRKLLVDCSMGMRKKVVLACALIHTPRVLFLDEPFNGIDARAGLAIRQVLVRLTESGTTIFFSSHILELVEKLCTRIAILEKGVVRAQGTIEEIAAKAGMPASAPFEDVFLRLVGHAADRAGDLSWLTSGSY